MSSLALSFNEVKFNPVVRDNGQIYLTAGELAQALDYKSVKSVSNLYNANKDEFTDSMTQIIESVTAGNIEVTESVTSKQTRNLKKKVRVFSLRGCHLIAMFARTAVAKQFRKWVLDILDKEVGAPVTKTHKSERTPLHDAHALLVAKTKHLNSSDAWKIINQRFGTNHIDEIPYDMIPVAVEYVHHLIAMYSSAEKKGQGSLFDEDQLELLKSLIDAIITQNFVTSRIYRAVHMLDNEQGHHLAEYAFKTNIAILKLTRAMDLRGPLNRKIISDDLKTISYTTGNQHYSDRWFHPLMESGMLAGALRISGGR
ncbi:alpha/beta hydrolase [Acinetobacter baumannii]|uniref:BRO-N domain-containing protein n=4 Tax=Acinetobacter baumannii TaxID=470 RepID=UPI000705720F|nr:BRO family protein [Acinetobacter baumannii]ALJ99160.1 BRO family, N-terminal domain protein [Acinetobacter phage Ab105-2phi]QZI85286.1 BRO family, N-terminal domain protein [Acinetobacter phage Ab105-2phideltaCI404ad]ODA53730.1 alpha/beta hydrolase [Acinetobacter baumannii]OLV34957.1 alpha/beta hydrolase [Acinetobacter baumannii]OLV39381.1 alpha/beta hydrolase [Acinetobacter baumannii]